MGTSLVVGLIGLDLDPNLVKPGYTPLLITLALAAVIFVLYKSMRKQVSRINPDLPHETTAGRRSETGIDEMDPPAPPTSSSKPTDLR